MSVGDSCSRKSTSIILSDLHDSSQVMFDVHWETEGHLELVTRGSAASTQESQCLSLICEWHRAAIVLAALFITYPRFDILIYSE